MRMGAAPDSEEGGSKEGVAVGSAEVDFQYSMRQVYDLQTGNKVKDPPTQVGRVRKTGGRVAWGGVRRGQC